MKTGIRLCANHPTHRMPCGGARLGSAAIGVEGRHDAMPPSPAADAR
jgi:hypothetical protein